ncbi:uncharacterized protein MONOS_11208 [Monocercomonoides exilis]|uniref:uncharacterized protein n=1 Tax=Monocercomonoides exilis TaxID=2049356 RepID=UPI0035593AB2|nr:hypothetical protein MONOS_11208 [Monocercomonoides exilis]|eukprot:MONOS_11208.1-p1 / transcript=MONOS_11208.1 / gene=MONOS_11208 / organism=Monocercomonoides_exilis_PA203 / gene_product=unspecified product / transcript_product=unspecified product / location=Mono_scaffold00550:23465-24400(-) / protein_length=312 / sequence_SO=supercontig / SO=protein_coding / is_pseudo=false
MEEELERAGLRMEDEVLSSAVIALVVLEEREEAEEGEKGGKEGEEKGEENGEEDGGREVGDGNEENGRYPTAHREYVEKIKEKQGKLEETMSPLVVEALGLSGLRFVKAEAEAGANKQHSEEPELCSSSPSDGTQLENRRAEEEEADGSLGITFDGSAERVRKDEEQVEMSANGLEMNEERGKESGLIDLEEEVEEERDNKGLRKGTHNKVFQYPQKPKEYKKTVKNLTGDELCDTLEKLEKLPGLFCEEETLPLLQPLGEQREEGGEGKRGAAKHRLLGWNNDIRNCLKRRNMMNEHHPSPSSPLSPSFA